MSALSPPPAGEKPEPNPEWEAKADAAHAAIPAEVGQPNPFDTLIMLETWKAHAEPADSEGRISFSRVMLDSAHDALKVALEMARAEYLKAKAALVLIAAATAVSEDASPNSDGALEASSDCTVRAALVLTLRRAVHALSPEGG